MTIIELKGNTFHDVVNDMYILLYSINVNPIKINIKTKVKTKITLKYPITLTQDTIQKCISSHINIKYYE